MNVRNSIRSLMATSLMISLIGGIAYASTDSEDSTFTYFPGNEDSDTFTYTTETFQKTITLECSEDYWFYGQLDSGEEQIIKELILPLKKDNVVTITLSSRNDTNLSVGIIEDKIKTSSSSALMKTGDSVTITAPNDGTYKVYMKNNKNTSSNFGLTVSYK